MSLRLHCDGCGKRWRVDSMVVDDQRHRWYCPRCARARHIERPAPVRLDAVPVPGWVRRLLGRTVDSSARSQQAGGAGAASPEQQAAGRGDRR